MQEFKTFYFNTNSLHCHPCSRYCGTNVSQQLRQIFQAIKASFMYQVSSVEICLNITYAKTSNSIPTWKGAEDERDG